MQDFWLTEAVFNNAAWCNTIAISHGVPTNWSESAWFSEHPMPRHYPNVVTLINGALIDNQLHTIDPRLSPGWGIKDSYGEFELEDKGFTLAFEAKWYCRLPNQYLTKVECQGFQLKAVQTPSDLNRWVAAWGEGDGVFNVTLLENKTVELIYIERDGQIVAGLATNQSDDSVGISNTFGPREDILYCVASVARSYPTKGIVGYDSKDEVVALSKLGFSEIGELRVWLRN